MSFTYAQLKQAIQDYAENDETSFVTICLCLFVYLKNEFLKMVQLSLFRKNATALRQSANQYLACPSDFFSSFFVSFNRINGDKFFVEFKDPSFVQTYTPDASTTGTAALLLCILM